MSAQGLTFLQITNVVLARMREAQVAAVTTTPYSTMIGTLVNQVKTEIENAFPWYSLRNTFSLTCTVGTTSYTFTDSGRGAVILNAYNTSVPSQMRRGTNLQFDRDFFGTSTVVTGRPAYYLPNGFDAQYDMKIDIWPKPDAADVLKFNMYIPQDDLSAGSDVPLCPINPLIEGVVARALGERGDDGGTAAQQQDSYYQRLLGDAVAIEAGHDPSEMNWSPV